MAAMRVRAFGMIVRASAVLLLLTVALLALPAAPARAAIGTVRCVTTSGNAPHRRRPAAAARCTATSRAP